MPSGRQPVAEMSGAFRAFSTLGLRDPERIQRWEEHNATALLRLTARSLDGAPLEAVEENLALPHLQLARVTANPHIVERTSDDIARGGLDGVALYFSLAGEAFFYHHDGVRTQAPGTLLICDIGRPFLRGFAHGLQEYVLVVPREIFEATTEERIPASPLVLHFDDVPGGDVHAAALAALLRRSLDRRDVESLAATEESALELLRTMFVPDPVSAAAAHRAAALAWISRNLHDPTVSVSRVARAVGVSERHLTRAFGETGAGVARTVLELRLELAHRLLGAPAAPAVRDVAARCGFVSHAHFSRVFRERYGMTPAERRREAPPADARRGLPDPAIR